MRKKSSPDCAQRPFVRKIRRKVGRTVLLHEPGEVVGPASRPMALGFSRSRRPPRCLPRSGCTTQPGVAVRGAPRGPVFTAKRLHNTARGRRTRRTPGTRSFPWTVVPRSGSTSARLVSHPGCAVQPLRGKNRVRIRVPLGVSPVPPDRSNGFMDYSRAGRGRVDRKSPVDAACAAYPPSLCGMEEVAGHPDLGRRRPMRYRPRP
jgi:hypothetical protein